MTTINWAELDKAADEAGKPAPDGVYTMVVKKATEGKSKKEDPQLVLVLEVADGPFKGKVAFDYVTFSAEGADFARQKLAHFGFKSLKEWGETQQRTDVITGRRVEVELTTDEYQGKKKNKIKRFVRGVATAAPSGVSAPPPLASPAAEATKPANPMSV